MFCGEEILKPSAAVRAEALVASLVAKLVVYLPGCDAFFSAVVFEQGAGDLFAVLQIIRAAVAGDVPPTKGAPETVFVHGQHIRIPVREPGRGRGGRRAEDNAQAPLPRLFDDAVEEGKVKASLLRLHDVPGKFTDADDVAAQFHYAVQVLLEPLRLPLFRIVINAQ